MAKTDEPSATEPSGASLPGGAGPGDHDPLGAVSAAASDAAKPFGVVEVFSIAAGAMISSGLFVLPGPAYAIAGPSIILAYLLAAILYLPALFAQAELATAMPRAGGSYFSVGRSLGPFAGTIAGLSSWFSISLKAAFAFIGIGAMACVLFPRLGEDGLRLVAVGSCLFFTVINMFSVKGAGRLQWVLVFALLAILFAFAGIGVGHVDPLRYSPFWGCDGMTFFSVVGLVFVSYGGLTKVVDVGGEVRDAGKTLPVGMFCAFFVVNLLYFLVVAVVVGVLPAERLSGSLAPVTMTAESLWGPVGGVFVGLAALLAYVTTGNAGILSASRSPVAMSSDGLMPRVFGRVDEKGSPSVAVGVTAFFMCVAITFLSVVDLVKAASAMLLLSFLLANVSILVMRSSPIEGYRPSFRAPFCPWLPMAAIIVYGVLIADMGTIPLLTTGGFLAIGVIWYILYVDKRVDRAAAVTYTVRRVMDHDLERTGLEDELLAISLERDGITPDRFDGLVRNAVVLDLEGPMGARELFRRLAESLAQRLDLPADEIEKLFLEREAESSTVISPHLAIPHIVVPGSRHFDIVLVRSTEGIVFSDLHPPVQAVFALLGTEDERNFHLKALVAVASIVQDPDFERRWLGARNAEQLRDVVLLSRRMRNGA